VIEGCPGEVGAREPCSAEHAAGEGGARRGGALEGRALEHRRAEARPRERGSAEVGEFAQQVVEQIQDVTADIEKQPASGLGDIKPLGQQY